MSVADTSALVALLDANHPKHAEASKALSQGLIVVTWGTLAQTATVVRRLAKDNGLDGNKAARAALAAIQNLAGFREATTLPLEAVTGLHGKETSLSFVDAWTLCAALAAGDDLLTLDHGLRAAARRHLVPAPA